MPKLELTGSVGAGHKKKEPHNQPEDVVAVRDRLVALGFDWIKDITKGNEHIFLKAITLFQSICKGSGAANKGDGRVDLQRNTHRWLEAENAPEWTRIFQQSGIGWRCTNDFKEANGGFCTDWLLDAIGRAGQSYTKLCTENQIQDSPPLWVRECSPRHGGSAGGHVSHQTGIDVDMRLPMLPPHAQQWASMSGPQDPRYNREAARIQLTAINQTMNPSLVLFNDQELINEHLCRHWPNHHNHYHIRIKPPDRILPH